MTVAPLPRARNGSSAVSVRVSHRKLLTSSGSSVPREIPTGPATICQVCFIHNPFRNFLLRPQKPLSIVIPPSFPATSAVNRPGVKSRSGHTVAATYTVAI